MSNPSRNEWPWFRLVFLFVVFGAALGFAVHRSFTGTSNDQRTVLHVGHFIPEDAGTLALEEIAREYTRLHPNVIVKFQRIPRSIYYQWFRTQLVSDNPPDIIQYNLQQDTSLRQLISRHFLPLNTLVNQPNPYNEGTSLAGVPLAKTYVDELRGRVAYFPEMGTYFGLPYSARTLRIVYNRDLMAEITGDPDSNPKTWDEFVALCERVKTYAGDKEIKLFPIAASQFGVFLVSNESFINVTQKLAIQHDYNLDFDANYPLGTTLGYLNQNWDLTTPEIRAGFKLYRQIGSFMQPGFLQFSDSDVLFQFLQGRALMMIAASPALNDVAEFELGVFRIPGIPRDDPEYGHYVLGPYSEAAHATTHPFGIPRNTPHRETAQDFLLFLTSQRINQQYALATDQVPVIRGVSSGALAKKFAPDPQGYPYGIQPRGLGRASSQMTFERSIYILFRPDGGIDDFIRNLEANQYREIVYRDAEVISKNYQQNLRETDVALTGRYLSTDQTDPNAKSEIARLTLRQTFFEMDALQTADVLAHQTPDGKTTPTRRQNDQ